MVLCSEDNNIFFKALYATITAYSYSYSFLFFYEPIF